jgi:hypothetical protein
MLFNAVCGHTLWYDMYLRTMATEFITKWITILNVVAIATDSLIIGIYLIHIYHDISKNKQAIGMI